VTETRTPFRYVRAADRLPGDEPLQLGPLDLAPILGTWVNSNAHTRGVSRFTVTERDGRVWVHAWAADPDVGATYDWGEVPVDCVYSTGARSVVGCGFEARFEFGHARTLVQTNQNHGVTVLAAFTDFTDGSGRQNYFSREFYQLHG